jgi:uncharacterized protein (DUF1697 family)
MDRVRQVFEDLGFTDVRSYIQSGNVFFESPERDQQALARKIESKLQSELSFEVATVVRTVDQVRLALSRDPFKGVPVDENTRLCVVFVTQPLPVNSWPVTSPKGDIELLSATDGEVFAVLHQSPGRAANPAAFVEKTYPGIKATSRFHHTLVKMMESMEK